MRASLFKREFFLLYCIHMYIILHWLVATVAVMVAAYVLPGVTVDSMLTAFIVAVVLGLLNALVRPLLIILTLPVNILTLGLFTFVINAAMILLAARLVSGFHVDGFWWALLFSVVLSCIGAILKGPSAAPVARS